LKNESRGEEGGGKEKRGRKMYCDQIRSGVIGISQNRKMTRKNEVLHRRKEKKGKKRKNTYIPQVQAKQPKKRRKTQWL